MDPSRTLLFDSASLYFRAFFGLPTSIRTPAGDPVNAVRGLLDFLARFITEYRPTHVACCWDDAWRPGWRVMLIPSYKAHRLASGDTEDVPPELRLQVPWIREVLAALGLPVVGAADYEADDVIATLAHRSSGPVDVVTGDRDLFGLVDDARKVRVLYVARGVAKHERVDDDWLRARYGISGANYVDFAVLRGDPSDGLPGVKGIGEKTATSLITRFGDLSGILHNAHMLSPAASKELNASAGYLSLAKQVVTAATDAPVPYGLDLTLPRNPLDPDAFARLRTELNLGGAADRILAALGSANQD